MGFALTILYVVLTIISPTQLGPWAGEYRPMVALTTVIVVVSLPELLGHRNLWSSTQTFLLVGFTMAIAASRATNGWLGGAVQSWLAFLPAVSLFFFIVANVTTIRRLRILMGAIVSSCLFVAVEAMCGYYAGFLGTTFIQERGVFVHDEFVSQFLQIRGMGVLNDPNDLAQILIVAMPLAFIFWRRHQLKTQLALALATSAVLLWAIYLTHSRGAIVGLAVLTLMALRNKLSTTLSIILAGAIVVAMLALNFSGGRGISINDGEDRLEAWSSGLQMFKSAPVFGVGYGAFSEHNNYLTAHNSLVLCLAELGLVGSTIWVALLVTTALELGSIVHPHTAEETSDDESQTPPAPGGRRRSLLPTHWVMAVYLGLISLIATSWFLSRSYSTTTFLVLGLATATIAIHRSDDRTQDHRRWILFTMATEAAGILFIYVVVRLR
jgi:O-antigen ligase